MSRGPHCHRGDIQPATCRRCKFYAHRATEAQRAEMDRHTPPAPRATATTTPRRVPLPCSWGTDLTGREREARKLAHGKNWKSCANAAHPLGEVVCPCTGCGPNCNGYAVASPDRVTRVDPARLAPVSDGRRFNPSVFDHQGKRLLAYRVGVTDSRIHVAELGPDLQPLGTRPVHLPHPKCAGGQEDPRLFAFGGGLWLMFSGLTSPPAGQSLGVSVMLAELDEGFRAVRVFEPRYARRGKVEKNWTPFEYGGDLYLSYSYSPHRVLRVDVDRGTAEDAFETSTAAQLPWSGGSIRGGAPPVRVGGELIHWFHGFAKEKTRHYHRYCAGVLATEAEPPFRVTRITPGPVWQPDVTRNGLNVFPDKEVIYPCGAVLDGGRWLVSAGHQDHDCVVGEFDAGEIDRLMQRVS